MYHFLWLQRGYTRLEYRYLYLEQSWLFLVFVVFNIFGSKLVKKVKRRGGLTNRQLNTYPSFLPQYIATQTQMYQNIVKVLVNVFLKYRQDGCFCLVWNKICSRHWQNECKVRKEYRNSSLQNRYSLKNEDIHNTACTQNVDLPSLLNYWILVLIWL